MNIDIRNSLDTVLSICEKIDGSAKADYSNKSSASVLVSDIYRFISEISIRNYDERFDRFSLEYLEGKYTHSEFSLSSKEIEYSSFNVFFAYEKKNEEYTNSTRELLQLFLNVGRHYTTDPYNRRDIATEKIIAFQKDILKLIEKNEAKIENNSKYSHSAISSQTIDNSVVNKNSISNDSLKENNEYQDTNGVYVEESLEELLEQLNSLIGLSEVKSEVNQIINLIKVQKKSEEFGEKTTPLSLHLVFFGNPGTGKTTVARLLAKIYKALGVLSTGQLVEVDRSGLVGGYVGQTAIKTQEVIDKAMGGILFIDEAYSLTHGKGESDFGQESVDTILKAMEDHRDDFVVIVAGYPDLMKEFISSNPGLKSRFNQYIDFKDYLPDELKNIFLLQCKKNNLILDDECKEFLDGHFLNMYNHRSNDYANGRDVRNYFENVYKMRANRLADIINTVSHEDFMKITYDDLKKASEKTNTI